MGLSDLEALAELADPEPESRDQRANLIPSSMNLIDTVNTTIAPVL